MLKQVTNGGGEWYGACIAKFGVALETFGEIVSSILLDIIVFVYIRCMVLNLFFVVLVDIYKLDLKFLVFCDN